MTAFDGMRTAGTETEACVSMVGLPGSEETTERLATTQADTGDRSATSRRLAGRDQNPSTMSGLPDAMEPAAGRVVSPTLDDGGLVTKGAPSGAPNLLITMDLDPAGIHGTKDLLSSVTTQTAGSETVASLPKHPGPNAADELFATASANQLEIGRLDLGAADQPGDVSVRLSLPQLGTIEIQFGKRDGVTPTMTISAERPETLHAIVSDQAQLRAALNESGLRQGVQAIAYTLLPSSGEHGSGTSMSSSPDDGGSRRECPDRPEHRSNGSARDGDDGPFAVPSAMTISWADHAPLSSINITA